jgi:hypothetical protein
VNRHALATCDSPFDSTDRLLQIRELERIVEVVQRRIQEAMCGLRIAEASKAEEPRDCRMQVERRAKYAGVVFIAWCVLPAELGHCELQMSDCRLQTGCRIAD